VGTTDVPIPPFLAGNRGPAFCLPASRAFFDVEGIDFPLFSALPFLIESGGGVFPPTTSTEAAFFYGTNASANFLPFFEFITI